VGKRDGAWVDDIRSRPTPHGCVEAALPPSGRSRTNCLHCVHDARPAVLITEVLLTIITRDSRGRRLSCRASYLQIEFAIVPLTAGFGGLGKHDEGRNSWEAEPFLVPRQAHHHCSVKFRKLRTSIRRARCGGSAASASHPEPARNTVPSFADPRHRPHNVVSQWRAITLNRRARRSNAR